MTGRTMAGARSLWRANGMKEEQFGKPVIAIVNSFSQFVPGHVHLHQVGQAIKKEIESLGMFAAEFNTIAIDDGIAMGHGGMLYSLPSRELIADSVEYVCNAHCADAMICISNCDKITPGMLMAAMRLNIPHCLSPAARWRPAGWEKKPSILSTPWWQRLTTASLTKTCLRSNGQPAPPAAPARACSPPTQ